MDQMTPDEVINEVVNEATPNEVVPNEVVPNEEIANEAPKNEVIIPSYCVPLSPAHHHNRIILLLMIKNEERIIQRCLYHALPHVDAISILDTNIKCLHNCDTSIQMPLCFLI